MGKLKGFMEYDRQKEDIVDPKERVKHYKEFTMPLEVQELREQGARCMDCGIPFCHSGCPLGNLIPDFNDAVYRNEWKKALKILHSTNNFPEFTGRLCPAPCETSCVLGIINPPVSIELIEKNIIERGFYEGWVTPTTIKKRTNKKVAVIGSGPAGLAAAHQLNRAGHFVTVFERENKVGGLLRYGIPDFKLEKHIIDRRINLLEQEGIIFKTSIEVGKNLSTGQLNKDFDAILLCTGSTVRRTLPIEGRNLNGVVQAMDFLSQNNKVVDGIIPKSKILSAKGKNVVVIGGGDTGSDCIGTCNRHGAKSITNFEIMDKPPIERSDEHPWPYWPFTLHTTTSHQEGSQRNWNIMTKAFVDDGKGNVKALKTIEVVWEKQEDHKFILKEKPNTEKEWACDLILLALGFTGVERSLLEQFGLSINSKGNVKTKDENPTSYQTEKKNIFVAGDARRGQSLIVWAISEGREAAYHVDKYLRGYSSLPHKRNYRGDLMF